MTTKDIVYIALFAAITAALGLFPAFTVPALGVPITAQTLGVMLAGAIAGPKRGGLAILLFVALVAVGLPLLSGGRGGMAVLLSGSGGFVLAWPVGAFVVGLIINRFGTSVPVILMATALGGILIVYVGGVPWLANVAGLSLKEAVVAVAVYLPGDVIKAVLATAVAVAVRKARPNL